MRTTLVAFAAALGLAGAACSSSRTFPLTTSAGIPAAEGTVKAEPTKNGNTALDIEVRHLAPPGRLDAATTTYVVWVQAPGEAAQNLGALRVDDGLRGRLRTVTPLRSFDLFITGEPGPTAAAPTGRPMLTARVEQSGG